MKKSYFKVFLVIPLSLSILVSCGPKATTKETVLNTISVQQLPVPSEEDLKKDLNPNQNLPEDSKSIKFNEEFNYKGFTFKIGDKFIQDKELPFTSNYGTNNYLHFPMTVKNNYPDRMSFAVEHGKDLETLGHKEAPKLVMNPVLENDLQFKIEVKFPETQPKNSDMWVIDQGSRKYGSISATSMGSIESGETVEYALVINALTKGDYIVKFGDAELKIPIDPPRVPLNQTVINDPEYKFTLKGINKDSKFEHQVNVKDYIKYTNPDTGKKYIGIKMKDKCLSGEIGYSGKIIANYLQFVLITPTFHRSYDEWFNHPKEIKSATEVGMANEGYVFFEEFGPGPYTLMVRTGDESYLAYEMDVK